MIVIKNQINITSDKLIKKLENQKDSLFFDIETTGLFWKRSHLYLIGAIYFENGKWFQHQLFLDRPSEEIGLLQEFATICRNKYRIIHYNGNGFDLPYLQHKYNFYQLENPMESMDSLDLYRKAKPFQNLFGLNTVKQKDMERFLEISRVDTYSGKELIPVYSEFLETRDENLLSILLQHNLEDVRGLVYLLPVLSYENICQGGFSVTRAGFAGYTLNLELLLEQPVPRQVTASSPHFHLQLLENKGELQIYGRGGTMKHFFPDYQNYYYLPLEDQAIHKSIGMYVDIAHREKAKASNCYQKAEGIFLPQPKERFQPVLYEDYKSKPAYFSIQEGLLQDMQKLHTYACDFLSEI